MPETPSISEEYFDVDGELAWTCNDEGLPTPNSQAYRGALDAFENDVDVFKEAIAARGEKIASLLEAEDETVASDTPTEPDQPDSDSDTKPDEGGEAAAEAPQNEPDTDTSSEPPVADAPAAAAPDDTVKAAREPAKDADNPNLFRRVISLPNAVLANAPGATEGNEIPTFSVLYVFDETVQDDKTWLEVSTSLREGQSGWIEDGKTLDWSSMLVMKFAPKGKRSDVLFFENDTELTDLVSSFAYAAEAQEIYDGIESERSRVKNDPSIEPEWDQRLVAMEPATAVTFENQPYLLPILDWQRQLFDGTIETTLLKVAAVPANASSVTTSDSGSLVGVDLDEAAANDGVFRVGVVFVVDTTISMRPFIDRTYQTIQAFFDSFNQYESASYVSFGVIGFRDEIKTQPAVEYVTNMFQPLDPEASARQVTGNLRRIQEAGAPTVGFKEDGFAGLIEAVDGNDWSQFDARLVVLITDASSRSGRDDKARYSGETAESVREKARNKNITILPIHLLTPTNQANGDAALAETQYQKLSQTGDTNFAKYFGFDATDGDEFSSALKQATDLIAQAVFAANSGQQASKEIDIELEEVPNSPAEGFAAAVANEVFRAQLESMAKSSNGSAPSFLAGWTADRDLLDPQFQTLEVSVYLTRNQLSTLDKKLNSILDAFRSGGDDPQAFFDNLQILAAETATDPDVVRSDEREALKEILPTFLQNLPYKSEILGLDRQYWGSLSSATRTEFIEGLEAKRKIYRDIFEQTELWQDFGADDPLLQVTPMRLTSLP